MQPVLACLNDEPTHMHRYVGWEREEGAPIEHAALCSWGNSTPQGYHSKPMREVILKKR